MPEFIDHVDSTVISTAENEFFFFMNPDFDICSTNQLEMQTPIVLPIVLHYTCIIKIYVGCEYTLF